MTLLERDPQAPRAWKGDLPVTNRYTFGLAGERFFRAIQKEGRILGSHCPKCALLYVPAVQFCERCMNELMDWVDVGVTGVVDTFTFLYENYDGTRRQTPEIVAFVRFGDGGLVHRLGEIDPEDVDFGLVVEAVFKPQPERKGGINDILYFKPVDS